MIGFALAASLLAGLQVAASEPDLPPASEVTLRHPIYRGLGVTAYLLEIPPGQGSQMHRHDRDMLTVFISGGRTTAVFEGSAPRTDALAPGTVRFRNAGFAHSTRNDDDMLFRAVLLEFDTPQGPRSDGSSPPRLFCTTGFCVDDEIVRPGAGTGGSRPRLFVPIAEIMVRDASGRRHRQPAGSIWAGRSGWTNAGSQPVRVISIAFR
jgi:quercetin dioxygenase-like cupin family protein